MAASRKLFRTVEKVVSRKLLRGGCFAETASFERPLRGGCVFVVALKAAAREPQGGWNKNVKNHINNPENLINKSKSLIKN